MDSATNQISKRTLLTTLMTSRRFEEIQNKMQFDNKRLVKKPRLGAKQGNEKVYWYYLIFISKTSPDQVTLHKFNNELTYIIGWMITPQERSRAYQSVKIYLNSSR